MGSDDPLLVCGSQPCASPGTFNTLLLSRSKIRKGTGYRSEGQSSLIVTDVKNTKSWNVIIGRSWLCLPRQTPHPHVYSLLCWMKGQHYMMKHFYFCYVDNFLFDGGSTTCMKEKAAQSKDCNKEGKVDQVGALLFDRDKEEVIQSLCMSQASVTQRGCS